LDWRKKAFVQNIISKLPEIIGDEIYYQVQRKFGTLKHPDFSMHHVQATISIAEYISKFNSTIEGKTFFELGTGRYLNLPIALWLLGASKIFSVDIGRQLKEESVIMNLKYIVANHEKLKKIFGKYRESKIFKERLAELRNVELKLNAVLSLLNLEYRAPFDASDMNMQNDSIDYYISYNVLEFIPPDKLGPILLEAKRILKQNGLFIHSLDFSDLFSEIDHSITSINFLQFNEEEWMKYAGNKYMYHNRMRVDDYEKLFEEIGIKIISNDKLIDKKALNELEKGFHLNERFTKKSNLINATKSAWVIAQKYS
jgi:SAM-dependent methyltransferase